MSQKQIAILIGEQYQELEVWYPYYRLQEAGHKIYMAGSRMNDVYPSKYGYKAQADVSYDALDVRAYDAVLIPGGYAPDHIRRSDEAVQFVKNMHVEGKLVAAICHGGWLLCSARIIEGRAVTSFSAIQADMENAGGEFRDEETVVDDNLITARTPDDLPSFTSELVKQLEAR
jgi:protease I